MSTLDKMGKRIEQQRKDLLGISQSKLAEKLCLSESSRTTISKWESSKSYPDIGLIPLLCDTLCCEAGFLFGDYDAPYRATIDIEEQTGLCFEASDRLRWYGDRNNELLQREKRFIEDLLCSEHLYNLVLAYKEYKEIFSCDEYAEHTEAGDLVCLPSGKCFLAVEADREKEIALFRFQKAIIAFAEEETKKDKKKKDKKKNEK